MSAPDYAAVLTAIRPGALWSMNDNDYSTLDWQSDDPKPTKKTLDDAWPQVQYDLEHAAVRQTRQNLYATETDPMFFEIQRGEGSATLHDWKTAVQAIKDAHPFPTDPT